MKNERNGEEDGVFCVERGKMNILTERGCVLCSAVGPSLTTHAARFYLSNGRPFERGSVYIYIYYLMIKLTLHC